MVTLGPIAGLKKGMRTKSESQEDDHRSKRPRLSPDDGVLENVLKKNRELNARVDALELLNKSLIENFRKRDDEINKQLQTLGAFDRTFVENDTVSRKRIDALEKVTKDNWAIYSSKQDKEIDVLKKSISAMSRTPSEHSKQIDDLVKSFPAITRASDEHRKELEDLAKSVPVIARASHEHDIQIERVVSKAAEMEQSLKQLQELCSSQNQKLEAASKVEKELRDRIMTVQKLALRQADSMKDANKEREETESRFARLEAMIASQTSRKNEWNQAFKTVIDRNSDAILQCQGQLEHILERVEALEKETEEQNTLIAKIEDQTSPDELDVMPKNQRISPRKSGRRSN
jgi:chromosome segregation ATPase